MTDPLLPALRTLVLRPVPGAARDRAVQHVTDWLGCAVAGASTEQGQAFLRAAAAEGAAGTVRVPGTGRGMPPRQAAFLAGAFGNPLEMDDLDRAGILHPGPVIVPAALAAVQIAGGSGSDLLDAVVRGYEATIRLGRSVGPGHYAKWHNTATCGPIGAAVATASALGLSEEQTLWAMGNALTQASGPWACRHEEVMTKQLHTARAAEAGLAAALLAQAGVTGPERIIEGPHGFYEAMCPDPDPGALLTDPESWRIFEVSFKPWPACRHCHPAIDAALALRPRLAPGAAIETIGIEVYDDAALFCDRAEPGTTIEAKFSLQHSVAAVLAAGAPSLETFEADGRADERIGALRARATVSRAADLTASYPAHYGARVAVTLAGGEELVAARRDALGDPEDPLDAEGLARKAAMLMGWAGLDADEARRLLSAAEGLPGAADLTGLIAALPKDVSQNRRTAA